MHTSRLLALVGTGLLLAPSAAQASTWEIDPSHSSIGFSVKHMMVATVKGAFQKVKGTLELDDKDITKSSIDVTIDVASIDTHDDKRDAHLKSADFFDVTKYPTAVFKSTKIQKAGKNKLKVTGDLTLHGVTKAIELDVEGPSAPQKSLTGGMVRAAHATGKLNRKDFGIVWNKALDSGGVLVDNEIKLDLNIELSESVKEAAATAKAETKAKSDLKADPKADPKGKSETKAETKPESKEKTTK